MDLSLSAPVDDVNATWTAYHTVGSDNSHHSSSTLPRSPQWPVIATGMTTQPTIRSLVSTARHTPPSTAMDIPSVKDSQDAYPHTFPQTSSGSLSSTAALDYSTSSSSPTLENSTSPSSDTEAMNGRASSNSADTDNLISASGDDHHMEWEQTDGDQLAIPKLEPIDEDSFRFEDVQAAPSDNASAGQLLDNDVQQLDETPTQTKAKRPRGRPRKVAVVPPPTSTCKLTKGRSKTGCITCRKRKKKCDEAKPRCMNCEKNAVVCEGYPEKQIWKSGKERAEEELLKNKSLPVITMQPIFSGMETPEDRVFWKHYNDHLSAVFTVEGEHRNGFQDMLVPLATRNHGMMHSILSLASRHLDYDTPYGAKILQRNTKVTIESLQQRGTEHNGKAVKMLYEAMGPDEKNDPDPKMTLAARYGQILCLVLESLAEGGASGSHRSHYNAFLYLIQTSPPQEPASYAFFVELFYYHIFADDLVHLPRRTGPPRLAFEEWKPAKPIHPPRLIGVADGLFNYITQITTIRNRIRSRIAHKSDPRVDYDSLYRASDIESELVEWAPSWPAGDSREVVTPLYKQMTWLYLKTTICPPVSPPAPTTTVSSQRRQSGTYLGDFQSITTSRVSSPSPRPELMTPMSEQSGSPRRNSVVVPSRKNSSDTIDSSLDQVHHGGNEDRASPPPIRRPSNHEPGINLAVEECLGLLESLKPSDPAQALLLIPCVIVGTACYAPAEQERIRNAIGVVHGYTGLRNTHQALKILNEIWQFMEQGEFLRAWDWQTVAYRFGIENLF